jgi:hypothetical protein
MLLREERCEWNKGRNGKRNGKGKYYSLDFPLAASE